jgi:hypothetical protein
LKESIEFIVNETVIEIEIAEAAALFPAVREQLSVDGCGRKFFVNDSRIESSNIHSLQLLLSDESISTGGSELLLSGFLGNDHLERLFLGCWKTDNRKNLWELMKEWRLDLESVDVSVVSVEGLDSLLLSDSILIESEDALLRLILKLGPGYRYLLRHIDIRFLSEDGLSLLEEDLEIPLESVWQSAAERIAHPPSPFESQIISDFPEIFAEFRRKRFSLLWRGSRDGFGASEFHRRCDGHGNTLTVILDTKGNIFGGFAPVEWEPPLWNERYADNENNCIKADESLKSFLFTLKNPHNVPARKFSLKAEKKHAAIWCGSDWGPRFYGGIGVSDNCNTKAKSYTQLDGCYTNDTGLDNHTFFTGSDYFQVKEIEIFEITA